MPEIEKKLTWEDLGTTKDAVGEALDPEFEDAYGERAAGVLRVYLLDQLMPYVGHDGQIHVRDQDKTHPYDMSDHAEMDIVTFEAVRMEYTDAVRDHARRLAEDAPELGTVEE